MPTEPCSVESAPCENRGFSWYDYGYTIVKRLCELIAWVAAIYDSVRVAPFGKIELAPVHYGFNGGGSPVVVTVPAGAVSIQATIDNEYASTYRLNVKAGAGNAYDLPSGTDFMLSAITPMFSADENGKAALNGYGAYPEYTFTWPTGARGFVTAIYRGAAPSLVL